MLTWDNVTTSYKLHFFYVLYSDKTWIFDQSERAQGPSYILIVSNNYRLTCFEWEEKSR